MKKCSRPPRQRSPSHRPPARQAPEEEGRKDRMELATKRVEQLKKQFAVTDIVDTYSVALPENVETDHEFRVRRSIHSPHRLVEGLAPPFAHVRTLYDLLESSLNRFADVSPRDFSPARPRAPLED